MGRQHPLARYPLRLFLFDDGVYVTRTVAVSHAVLGKRIVRIGTLPIDTVIRRLRTYLHGDNEYNRRDILETRLLLHEVLAESGATKAGHATFVVADDTGQIDSPPRLRLGSYSIFAGITVATTHSIVNSSSG